MILIFLKNLKNWSKQKKNHFFLKMQLYFLIEGKQFLMLLKVGYFEKNKQGTGLTSILDRLTKVSNRKIFSHQHLKLLTPKQMFERLPIELVQVKAGNTSENLLNEIRQVIYFLY